MITSMLFFPEKVFLEKPSDYGLVQEDVSIETSDGIKLHGWFFEAKDSKATLLFFHGNAGNISGRLHKMKGWIDRSISVLMVDYRGYGKSQGEIKHEEDLLKDARASLNYLMSVKKQPLDKIIIHGESLGTYPSIRIGTEFKVMAVLLEAPFTSFVDLAAVHYSAIPGAEFLLKDFKFSNKDYIKDLKVPLFVMHGTQDETCPYHMSDALIDIAPEPKTFFSIPDGAHNDLPLKAGDDYWDKPYQFVSKYLP